MNTLQSLVSEALSRAGGGSRLSLRDAQALTGVSKETIRMIAVGEHGGDLDEATIDGLAKGLGIDIEQLTDAVGQRPILGRFELPRRADRLTLPERRVVLAVIDAILSAARADRSPPANRVPVTAKEAQKVREAAASDDRRPARPKGADRARRTG